MGLGLVGLVFVYIIVPEAHDVEVLFGFGYLLGALRRVVTDQALGDLPKINLLKSTDNDLTCHLIAITILITAIRDLLCVIAEEFREHIYPCFPLIRVGVPIVVVINVVHHVSGEAVDYACIFGVILKD